MKRAAMQILPLLTCLVAAGLLAGCSGPKSYVVLLPVDGKVSGAVEVSNAHGSQLLNQSWQATEISGTDVAPSKPVVQGKTEVQSAIGPALDAMPLPPVHFTLYFEMSKTKLTPESRRMLPEILKAVNERNPAELSVVGHTDTVGAPTCNYHLGLLRAKAVIALLTQLGVNPSLVEVDSHGEADLFVKTPDNTPEPRNRRIEVTIR